MSPSSYYGKLVKGLESSKIVQNQKCMLIFLIVVTGFVHLEVFNREILSNIILQRILVSSSKPDFIVSSVLGCIHR